MRESTVGCLTQDVLQYLVYRTPYSQLLSPERTVRKYVKIYYGVVVDLLNDKAEEMHRLRGTASFQRVEPSEGEERYSIIPAALMEYVQWDELEEVVSVFGTGGRPPLLTSEEEEKMYAYVATRASLNMPVTQSEFLEEVSEYLSATGRISTSTPTPTSIITASGEKRVTIKRTVQRVSKRWLRGLVERLEKRGYSPLLFRNSRIPSL
eukprot:ANDGO_00358.mRNA.1 hypothetical protein